MGIVYRWISDVQSHVKDVEQAILRLLADSELSLTPNNIAKNTGISGGYIRRDCNRMAKLGLLEKDDAGSNPFYTITEQGQAYLEENLAPEDL